MGNAWKAGACVLALSVVWATGAEARRVSSRCAQPSEVAAIQTTVIDQQLVDAALTCGDSTRNNFNAYRTSFGRELRLSDRTLLTMFKRVYGGSRGDAQYNLFKTDMASKAELRRDHDPVGFCKAADDALAAALAPAKPSLNEFVAGVPVADTETPVSSCSVAVNVAFTGVMAVPSVVPKPRPPQPGDQPEEVAALTPQPQQGGIKVGTLTCNVSSGMGFIFGSKKSMDCSYQASAGSGEHYSGTFSKYGIDIGYADKSVLVWTVVAPTSSPASGALAGDYAGATAGATVGVGLGANVLVGGSNKSIALQPVSVSGSTGINVAAGIGVISLKYEPQT